MINDNTPIFDLKIKDKSKINLYALFEYFSLLLLPYISLYFTDKEINKLVRYFNKNELTKAINYIKRLINFHGFHKLYVTDSDFRNLFTFIAAYYDKQNKKFNTELVKENFEISKEIIFNIMNSLTNNNKNKYNDKDYNYFVKAANWITKIFNLNEKNKFFAYFTISKDRFYDIMAVSNYISNLIISGCKKANNYNDFNIVNSELFDEMCDRDKNLIKPVIDYLTKNLKCVNLEEFNNLQINQNMTDDDLIIEKIKNQNINELKNQLLKSNIKKEKYDINNTVYILNKSLYLVWNCYIVSTLLLIDGISEINKFINNLEFIKYVKDDEKTTNDNVKKIRNLMIFNMYNKNLNKIVEIFKEYYPKKYKFLGLSNVIIQPYILFTDLINIITDETKTNKIIKLFNFKDNNNKTNLFYILNKKKYDNNDLEKNIINDVKETGKYFILVIDNNTESLDQKNYDKNKERKDKYPINLKINNVDYKIHSYIIFIPEHHYEYDKFDNSTFREIKISRKNSDYITDNEFKKDCNFKYYYHMIIYEKYY